MFCQLNFFFKTFDKQLDDSCATYVDDTLHPETQHYLGEFLKAEK